MPSILISEKVVDQVLKAMKMTDAELTTLVARLPDPYRRNVQTCSRELRDAIDAIEKGEPDDQTHLVLGQCPECFGINRHEPNCERKKR